MQRRPFPHSFPAVFATNCPEVPKSSSLAMHATPEGPVGMKEGPRNSKAAPMRVLPHPALLLTRLEIKESSHVSKLCLLSFFFPFLSHAAAVPPGGEGPAKAGAHPSFLFGRGVWPRAPNLPQATAIATGGKKNEMEGCVCGGGRGPYSIILAFSIRLRLCTRLPVLFLVHPTATGASKPCKARRAQLPRPQRQRW
jgi:hypothetical protein